MNPRTYIAVVTFRNGFHEHKEGTWSEITTWLDSLEDDVLTVTVSMVIAQVTMPGKHRKP